MIFLNDIGKNLKITVSQAKREPLSAPVSALKKNREFPLFFFFLPLDFIPFCAIMKVLSGKYVRHR